MSAKAIITAALVALSPAAWAQPLPGDQVQGLILSALAQAGQSGAPVLSVNRPFPACDDAPRIVRAGRDWRAVDVICAAPVWSRRVRIDGAVASASSDLPDAQAKPGEGWVLSQPLTKGEVVLAEMLRPAAKGQSAGADGVITDPAQIIGRTMKANLGEGRILLARHVEYDWKVLEGTPLVIEAALGAIVIQSEGIALQDGQIGQRVRVRNAQSGQIVHATVMGLNLVRVGANIR